MGRFENLVGQRFNRLLVLERAENTKQGQLQWLCQCDCGNTCIARGCSLKNGAKKSCGCLRKETARNNTFKDIEGEIFGRLTVIKEIKNDDKEDTFSYWLCRCECGNEVVVTGVSLRNGNTKSCGCLQKDKIKEISKEMWENEEYREKMSEKAKEKWEDEEYSKKIKHVLKENNEINKEKWKDEEYRKTHTGEKHFNYNSNLTEEDRQDRRCQEGYKEWSYKVKEGANFTCDCCDRRGGKLHSHHLDSYNWCKERRLDVENGVCLCESCHKEFHKFYGKGNNTKQQYIEFKNKEGEINE